MWQFWLIASGIFFIAEIITVGFLIFWLGIGALITMIVSFFTSNLIIQTTVFVISSTILIFATRPLINKFGNTKTTSTNAFSLVGKKGIVTQNIDSIRGTGQIKVQGELWSAISKDSDIIPKNTEVEILSIKGVKLIVTPVRVSSTLN